MKAINITAYTEDSEKINAIKAVLKAMKIKFEIFKTKPYDPAFIEMVQNAEEQVKKGKSKKIAPGELNKIWK